MPWSRITLLAALALGCHAGPPSTPPGALPGGLDQDEALLLLLTGMDIDDAHAPAALRQLRRSWTAAQREPQPKRALMIHWLGVRMKQGAPGRWSAMALGSHGEGPPLVASTRCAAPAVADLLIERLGPSSAWLAGVEPARRGAAWLDAATRCVLDDMPADARSPHEREFLARQALFARAEPFLLARPRGASLEAPVDAAARDRRLARRCSVRWDGREWPAACTSPRQPSPWFGSLSLDPWSISPASSARERAYTWAQIDLAERLLEGGSHDDPRRVMTLLARAHGYIDLELGSEDPRVAASASAEALVSADLLAHERPDSSAAEYGYALALGLAWRAGDPALLEQVASEIVVWNHSYGRSDLVGSLATLILGDFACARGDAESAAASWDFVARGPFERVASRARARRCPPHPP